MRVVSRDDLQSAKQFGQQAISLLDFWSLPISPINYAVAYEIVKGENARLLDTYHEYIEQYKNIDEYCLEQWQIQFLQSENPDNNKVFNELDKIVSEVQEKLSFTDESVSAFVEQLVNGVEQIKKSNSEQGILPAVKSLISASNLIKWQQGELKKQLESSRLETSQLQQQLKQIEKQAKSDPLTGLLNRRGLDEYLQEIRHSSELMTIVIDIDHFKKINDSYGHMVGDVVIAKVAEQIRLTAGKSARVARFGGEEFIVVIEQQAFNRYPMIAEDIRKKVADLRLVSKKRNTKLPPVTVSLGVARQNHTEDFSEVLTRADKALYAAKAAGRDQVQYAK